MLSKLVLDLFPQGQRKVMVSMMAIVIGVALEKLGGGLSVHMEQALVAIVAIFTGGNVLEHLSSVLRGLKGTKVGQVIEDAIPGDQGLGREEQVQMAMQGQLDGAMGAVDRRFAELEKKLETQAANLGQLVGILNQMRQAKPQG